MNKALKRGHQVNTTIQDQLRRHLLWVVMVVSLVIRLVMALISEQMHHPDEIFQYLEQSHRLVFGYGIVPWEYRFGIRSWILPGLLAIPLYACKLLHLDQPGIYIPLIKSLLCFLSISVIYSSYIIGKNLSSERSGQLAAIFTCFWYELIFFAHRPTPEVLASYLLLGGIAIVTSKPQRFLPLVLGIICSLCVALRLQYFAVMPVLGIVMLRRWPLQKTAIAVLSAALTFLGAGLVDYWTWGKPFVSFWNNYLFNKTYNVSAIFGEDPFYFYIITLAVASLGIFLVIGVLGLTIISRTWILIACTTAIIFSHSLIAHKEHRFIFAATPSLLIIAAILIDHYFQSDDRQEKPKDLNQEAKILPVDPRFCKQSSWFQERFMAMRGQLWTPQVFLTALLATISFSSMLYLFPLQYRLYGESEFGTARSMFDRQAGLVSYLYLSQEKDVFGIFNAELKWAGTGSYYYLHQNAPIYYPYHRSMLEAKGLRNYVSHIICQNQCPETPEFSLFKQTGTFKILKLNRYPDIPQLLGLDLWNVSQPGVDDRYIPNVKPFP